MKKIVMGLGAAALLASGGIAYAQAGHGDGARGHMAKVDANNDGQITRAEMMASVDTMFAHGDVDKDGKIDKADRTAMQAQMRAKMWDSLDADKDGSISRAEWDAAHAARMAKREQMRAEHKSKRAEAGNAGEHGDHAKGKRRGGHRGEMSGMMDGHRGGGMAMLAMADTDKDGAVTLAEARAAAAKHFDMLDADKDGVVTKAEMDAMRAKHMAERKAHSAK